MSKVKLLVAFLSFCFISTSFSQPLNSSFENWTNGNPDDWLTTGVPTVNQSNVAFQGTYSAYLEVIELAGFPYIPIMNSVDESFIGHPVSGKPGSLQGRYQFMPLGNDLFVVNVLMLAGNVGVGAGSIAISSSTSGWTQFTCPITYGPATPDNTIITITITDTSTGGTFGTIGSYGYIDDLGFTGPAAVEQINGLSQDFYLSQNYPNPFNPSTKIHFSIPERSDITLKVFDVLGKEVATLLNEEKNAGNYQVDFSGYGLPSGIYFYTLNAGNFTETKKLVLMK